MTKEFTLKGNVVSAIRSDEELALIDKDIADTAFKVHKKALAELLKQKGFVKFKSNSFLRRNQLEVLEYIDIQKERYGSKTFTVNYALTSLYVPHSFFSFDISERLGNLICGKDIWWDYSNELAAEESFNNIIEAIDSFLLPWFAEKDTADAIKDMLLSEKKKRENHGGRLSDCQTYWLNIIENNTWNNELVAANIETFKLPKKLIR